MAWLGRGLTGIGVLLMVLPILGGLLSFVGPSLPYVVEYAPTFILGGMLLFVIGVALRAFFDK